MEDYENQKGFSAIEVILVIALVVLVGVAGWFVYDRQNKDNESTSKKDNETSQNQDDQEVNLIAYEHPVVKYSLQYPADWKLDTETIERDNSAIGFPYRDFAVLTTDYKAEDGGQLEGGRMFVRVEDTSETSIDTYFNGDPLIPEIATNKKKITVDGQEAIQYDFGYETKTATATIFIKNGKYYYIELSYPSTEDKSNYVAQYTELLDSFKAQ